MTQKSKQTQYDKSTTPCELPVEDDTRCSQQDIQRMCRGLNLVAERLNTSLSLVPSATSAKCRPPRLTPRSLSKNDPLASGMVFFVGQFKHAPAIPKQSIWAHIQSAKQHQECHNDRDPILGLPKRPGDQALRALTGQESSLELRHCLGAP